MMSQCSNRLRRMTTDTDSWMKRHSTWPDGLFARVMSWKRTFSIRMLRDGGADCSDAPIVGLVESSDGPTAPPISRMSDDERMKKKRMVESRNVMSREPGSR